MIDNTFSCQRKPAARGQAAQVIGMEGRDGAVSPRAARGAACSLCLPVAASRWRSLLTVGRNGVNPRVLRYLEIRYENLIRDPANTPAEILAFLGLEGNPERLFSLYTIHNTSTGVWKTKLDVKERKAFQRKAGDMLMALGYEKGQSWVDTTSKNQ